MILKDVSNQRRGNLQQSNLKFSIREVLSTKMNLDIPFIASEKRKSV